MTNISVIIFPVNRLFKYKVEKFVPLLEHGNLRPDWFQKITSELDRQFIEQGYRLHIITLMENISKGGKNIKLRVLEDADEVTWGGGKIIEKVRHKY